VVLILVGGMSGATSGVLVKHHFGSGSDGSTEVERHSVNLHPGASA
jgi:hypothetical protein